MKPLTRFMTVIEGKKVDAALCVPLVFGYAASFSGISLKSYLQNGEQLAWAQLQTQRAYGYDAVFVNGGNSVEAEALGCLLHFSENDYPYVIQPVLEDLRNASDLEIPDPFQSRRMSEMISACRILRKEVGDSLPVVGCVLGPASIAGQLAGLEKLLFLLADDPAAFQQVLNTVMKVSLDFGKALLQAGAHLIMLMEPTASQNIFPPAVFRQFMVPLITELCRQFHQAGALAVWLMITGKIKDILPYYRQCGVDLATVDYEVPLADAVKAAPDLALTGNIRPYELVSGQPKGIETSCFELLQAGQGAHGFILGTGCEVPLHSNQANIEAMVRATRGDR